MPWFTFPFIVANLKIISGGAVKRYFKVFKVSIKVMMMRSDRDGWSVIAKATGALLHRSTALVVKMNRQ